MNLKLRVRENPWRLMLAANVAVVIGVFLYKLTREPYVPYIHLLVDYHFGFTKRALIGATLSLFFPKIPVWLVFALSGVVWLVTTALFIKLFRRTFGLCDQHLPLFVFITGSPFFLKNFMHTLGHFDIYGCVLAISLLLAPSHSVAFVIVAAVGSMILILIHHIHLLMYVPTIAVIVVLRYYLVLGFNRWNVAIGILSAVCVALLFISAQFFGTITVPEGEVYPPPAEQNGGSEPKRSTAIQLHLVPAAFKGNPGYVAAPAIQHSGNSSVRTADLAAQPRLEVLCQVNPRVIGRIAPPHRDRQRSFGEHWLSDHVCDRVRLLPVDLELGGLHVSDFACRQNPACLQASAADFIQGPDERSSRLGRDARAARRHRQAILKY